MQEPQSATPSTGRLRAEISDDAVDLLLGQHRQIRRLFEVFGREKGEGRKETSQRISDVLLVHARLEEEIFYPLIQELGGPDMQQLIGDALREHHAAEQTLFQLLNLSYLNPDFDTLMQQLEDDVLHHLEEEEAEVLPKARELLPDADALAKEMAALMEKVNPAEIRNEWARRGKID